MILEALVHTQSEGMRTEFLAKLQAASEYYDDEEEEEE
jgi:hypothetical protein